MVDYIMAHPFGRSGLFGGKTTSTADILKNLNKDKQTKNNKKTKSNKDKKK